MEPNQSEDAVNAVLELASLNPNLPVNVSIVLEDGEEESNLQDSNKYMNQNPTTDISQIEDRNTYLQEYLCHKSSDLGTNIMSSHIDNSLNIISDNLIHIIKMHHRLYQYQRTYNLSMQQIRMSLRRCNYHYYKLSYDFMIDNIAKLENDKSFLNSFLLNTIRKSQMPISYEKLADLLKDMLQWTKLTLDVNTETEDKFKTHNRSNTVQLLHLGHQISNNSNINSRTISRPLSATELIQKDIVQNIDRKYQNPPSYFSACRRPQKRTSPDICPVPQKLTMNQTSNGLDINTQLVSIEPIYNIPILNLPVTDNKIQVSDMIHNRIQIHPQEHEEMRTAISSNSLQFGQIII